ncbi:hypothetical protein D3C81_1068260 [compost metagenome]
MAVAVHVRVRGVGPVAEVVQVLGEVQQAQRDLRDHHHDQQCVAEELVVGQDLQDQRHAAHQHIEHRTEGQHLQVQQRLQVGIALHQLHGHRHHRTDGLEAGDDHHQGGQPGQQRYPAGYGHGVVDFVQADRALLPDQFAGIEQHDDHQQPAVGALQGRQHFGGDRPDRRAIDRALVQGGGDEVGQAQHQQHDERHPAQDAEGVKAHLAHELVPAGCRAEAGAHARRGDRRRSRRIGAGHGLATAPTPAPTAGTLGAEQSEGGGEQDGGHPQPQGTVGQQVARHLGQAGVALLGGPVADRATERAHAQWLGQRGDPDVVDIAQQRRTHAIQHEVADQADVDPQDRARQRRQQRQQGGGEQHVGQHDPGEGPSVAGQRNRADAGLVHPGHERPQEDAQRDDQVDHQAGADRCQDASGQVIAALDRACEDQLRGAQLEVAQQCIADEQGGHQHAHHGEDAHEARDDDRRIAVHVVDAAADLYGFGGGGGEGQRGEQERQQP